MANGMGRLKIYELIKLEILTNQAYEKLKVAARIKESKILKRIAHENGGSGDWYPASPLEREIDGRLTELMVESAVDARRLYQEVSNGLLINGAHSGMKSHLLPSKEAIEGYWLEALIGEAIAYVVLLSQLPTFQGSETGVLPQKIKCLDDMYDLIDNTKGTRGYEIIRGTILGIASSGNIGMAMKAIEHIREQYPRMLQTAPRQA